MDFFRGQSSAVTALAVTTALAAGVFLTTNLFGKADSTDELLPALTEEETVKIMRSIMDKMKMLATRMIRGAENIKQQIQAQGQHIEDAQLMKSFILPHFDTGFEELQQDVLTEAEADEADLEEAFNYYYEAGNKELKDISDRIRLIYKEFGGVVVEDGDDATVMAPPKEIDSQQFMQLLLTLTEKLTEHTESYVVSYKEKNGIPSSMPEMEKFQHGLLSLTEGVEKDILDAHGLSQMDFQSTLMQHQHSPEVQEIFIRMQRENERVMTENGIRMQ